MYINQLYKKKLTSLSNCIYFIDKNYGLSSEIFRHLFFRPLNVYLYCKAELCNRYIKSLLSNYFVYKKKIFFNFFTL